LICQTTNNFQQQPSAGTEILPDFFSKQSYKTTASSASFLSTGEAEFYLGAVVVVVVLLAGGAVS